MTWVLGWPFYEEDAIEVARKHNLVKDPEAGDWKLVQAARSWVADRAGLIRGLSCWVGTIPELVIAAYVDYGDCPTPPEDDELGREELMSKKQYRRLKKLMPLRDFGWYQHNDPHCTLYKEIVYVYDDDDDGEEEEVEEEHGEDTEDAEVDEEVVDDDGASDWEDEDTTDSDTETVTTRTMRKSSA